MPPTREISEYIRAIYDELRNGQLSSKEAIDRLDATKAREELRLTMSRQRFSADPSERESIRNRERWHRANIHALESATQQLARGMASDPQS
jgi:hypothetical protein